MMTFDKHDEGSREGARSDGSAQQSFVALRSLAENGVDVTGSESGVELTLMKGAVDAFRRAAEALARVAPVILVVGSRNSSNSNRLVEEAELVGARAHLVDAARLSR